jgi:hypothetical protein
MILKWCEGVDWRRMEKSSGAENEVTTFELRIPLKDGKLLDQRTLPHEVSFAFRAGYVGPSNRQRRISCSRIFAYRSYVSMTTINWLMLFREIIVIMRII